MARSKYNELQKKKRMYCEGKTTKSAVQKKANEYIRSAVNKGQTKTEAQRKANKVAKKGCSMSSNIRTNSKKSTRSGKGTRKTAKA